MKWSLYRAVSNVMNNIRGYLRNLKAFAVTSLFTPRHNLNNHYDINGVRKQKLTLPCEAIRQVADCGWLYTQFQ